MLCWLNCWSKPFSTHSSASFSLASRGALVVALAQAVEEGFVLCLAHVAADIQELVQQTEPKIVKVVVTQVGPKTGLRLKAATRCNPDACAVDAPAQVDSRSNATMTSQFAMA